MASNIESLFPEDERQGRQCMPPDRPVTNYWSDANAEEERRGDDDDLIVEVPRHRDDHGVYSSYCGLKGGEDVLVADKRNSVDARNGTRYISKCNNDEEEVATSTSQNIENYHKGDNSYNEEQEEFFDDDGLPILHVRGIEDYQSDGDSFGDGFHDTKNNPDTDGDCYYYHDYDNNKYLNEETYRSFDIGNLQQIPYPPLLDFGHDDNRYEADDECNLDDFGQDEQQNGDDEYNDQQSQAAFEQANLPQLSAESRNVVHRIEVLIERIFSTLDNMGVPQISGYRGSSNDDDFDDDDDSYKEVREDVIVSNLNDSGDQTFSRTWGVIGQARTFTSICLVLSFIHQLLLSMRTTTTREVYYVFVTHFRSQRECDSTILDVAKILGVSRRSLGLSASPKGWFCGCVEITRRGILPSGKDVSGMIDGTALSSIQGLPITREWIERDESGKNEQGVEISVSSKNAKCILVIEKEGVFNRLSEERLYDRFPCIMITGKGFPDLCTRALVKTLHKELNLPVVGLCDMNPYGISVLSVYHCAGNRMGVDGNYRYSVPIKWMGLRPKEVKELHEKHKFPDSVFQELTDLDKKRIYSLTDEMNPYLDDDEKDEVAEEMKYKVELEALYWLGSDFLGDWVFKKLESTCRFEL